MQHSTIKASLLLGVAATGLGIATPALAQAADPNGFGDIIVTARRIEERLQDVPISITVFNQEQICQPQHRHRRPISRTYTPSLSVNQRFGPEKASFAIRGFIQDNCDRAVGRRLFRRRRRAARARRHDLGGNGAGAGHVLRPAERPGAQGPAGHAVRPQHDRRRGAAGAAEADRPARRLCRGLGRQLRHAARPGGAQRAAGRHLQGPPRRRSR